MSTRLDPAKSGDLDVDVLIWDVADQKEEKAGIEADPQLDTLRVMKERHTV